MQGSQNYELTIRDLFTISSEGVSGAEAMVSILDGALEIDRVTLSGKVGPGESVYRRQYKGKPGLKAALLTEVGQITFAAI